MSLFWIAIICAAVFMVILIALAEAADNWDSGGLMSFLLSIPMCLILTLLILGYNHKGDGEPQAIDVYRGNTTLQITYQDSIPVDSVVVFKNK